MFTVKVFLSVDLFYTLLVSCCSLSEALRIKRDEEASVEVASWDD